MFATLTGFGILVGITLAILVILYGFVVTMMTLGGTTEWDDSNWLEKLTAVMFCVMFVGFLVWLSHEVGVKYMAGRLFQ